MRRWRRGDPADSSVGAGRRVFVIFHGGTTPASPATRINLNVLKTPFLSQYSSALNFCFLVSYTTLVIILRPRNFARPRLRVPLYLVSYRPAQPPVSPPREPTRRLAPPGPPPHGTGGPEYTQPLFLLTCATAPRAASWCGALPQRCSWPQPGRSRQHRRFLRFAPAGDPRRHSGAF